MQIDHVGVATDEAAALATQYAELFATEIAHEEVRDGMDIYFLPVGETYFEFLEPLDDGPIADFLDREGPGLHHVAVTVDSAVDALDRARALGIEPIDDQPRPGAWGHDVAFLHPRDTGSVLLEFVGY
ncbi:MAG: methylmalonyl-CoA epimerase [Salinarchaeum sp.]